VWSFQFVIAAFKGLIYPVTLTTLLVILVDESLTAARGVGHNLVPFAVNFTSPDLASFEIDVSSLQHVSRRDLLSAALNPDDNQLSSLLALEGLDSVHLIELPSSHSALETVADYVWILLFFTALVDPRAALTFLKYFYFPSRGVFTHVAAGLELDLLMFRLSVQWLCEHTAKVLDDPIKFCLRRLFWRWWTPNLIRRRARLVNVALFFLAGAFYPVATVAYIYFSQRFSERPRRRAHHLNDSIGCPILRALYESVKFYWAERISIALCAWALLNLSVSTARFVLSGPAAGACWVFLVFDEMVGRATGGSSPLGGYWGFTQAHRDAGWFSFGALNLALACSVRGLFVAAALIREDAS
jgi:hypothetical protein